MNKELKIGVVVTNLAGSGAERVALNLAKFFHRFGLDVHLILLEDLIKYDLSNIDFKLHSLTKSRKFYKKLSIFGDFLLSLKFKKLINSLENDKKFDLIISNLPASDSVVSFSGFKKAIYIIHNTYSKEFENFSLLKSFWKKLKYKKIYDDKVLVCVSKGAEVDLINNTLIKPKYITTIYNPFDFEEIREESQNSDENLPNYEYILSPAANRVQKRLDVLLEAYSMLKNPPKLVLLANPCKQIDEWIEKYNLKGRVEVLGFQKNPYAFMRGARLVVLSSEREGLPTVLIESLICGTMIVSTNCPSGPSEIMINNLSKYLAKVNNPSSLAQKIELALSENEDINEEDLKMFDYKNVCKEYIELFENVF
ncbi:MAG: glycosyltransferase [Campylobacterales bacterium]|nr:glycosyltransferase [Campylobacterales bacterium]